MGEIHRPLTEHGKQEVLSRQGLLSLDLDRRVIDAAAGRGQLHER
jgi:hypothetical protein